MAKTMVCSASGIRRLVPCGQTPGQILERAALDFGRRAKDPRRRHEVVEVAQGEFGRLIQRRMGLGAGLGRIAADEAPKPGLVLGPRDQGKVQKHLERHHHVRGRHIAAMDMPDRVRELLVRRLLGIGAQLLVIFIHRLGDDVEIHPLRGLGFLIHEIAQALGRRIGQPFVDGKPVTL